MNYGEIIQLGRHRLMCGDATKPEHVQELTGGETVDRVLTDPPYGINIIGPKARKIGGCGKTYPPVIGDADTMMFRDAWKVIRLAANKFIIWGGQNFTDVLPPSCGWLFWDKCKNTDALSFGDGELAWCNFGRKIKKYALRWNGNRGDFSPELNVRVHPTQKPVELHMRILEDFSQEGDIILDCFGGSGTTLIAAEMTGRTCYMMEISPEYCDVIAQRYERFADSVFTA